MQLLRKLEDIFVQVIRLVLMGFALLVLVALAAHLWDKISPKKAATETSANAVDWTSVKPDMKFVLEETGRDMGTYVPDQALQERLGDAAVRAHFKQFDQLVRDFIAKNPEAHARVEKDNEARGLAPLNPLLVGDTAPSAEQIQAYQQTLKDKEQAESARMEQVLAQASDAPEEAASASCCDSSNEMFWAEPVDLAQLLHERAVQTQSEYGEQAYAAYVAGAPAAMALVLNDATLAPKLQTLTVARLVDMVLVNYGISFGRSVSEHNGDSSDSLWDTVFSSIEMTMWSVILSFLVLVVFVVMMMRMEKHLRTISLHHTPRD